MIATITLSKLRGQKLKDCRVLHTAHRNSAAIYFAGYALEFAFKRKIANTLGLSNGFPETAADFASYGAQIASFNAVSTGLTLTNVRQIRNHDLNALIQFSGAEARIKSTLLTEWLIVQNWNPEDRYKFKRYKDQSVSEFLRAVKKIVEEIT